MNRYGDEQEPETDLQSQISVYLSTKLEDRI